MVIIYNIFIDVKALYGILFYCI